MKNKNFFYKLAEVLEVSPNIVDEKFELQSGNWDSVALMATIALIDEFFNVTVPTTDLMSCTDVASLLRVIRDASGEN